MRLSQTKMFLLAAAASLHLHAHASLINPDEVKIGNLTWLKLHETVDLDMNDFANGAGGWNSRYRFATDAELAGMLSEFSLPMGATDYSPSNYGAINFIFTLGGSFGTGPSLANPMASGRGLGYFVTASLTDGENGMPLSADCPAFTPCARSLVMTVRSDVNLGTSFTGLFLVRNEAVLPEPSTLALMGLAGAAFAARRRKSRAG